MNSPKVSIIILNWNGLEDTTECLKSLQEITYTNYAVIVVDNGSEGNDAEVLDDRFGDYIHLIKNDKNYGFAEGNNIGIRRALSNFKPDYVLLLNNDTVVDSKFLTEMIAAAETDEKVGIVGGVILYYNEPQTVQSFGAETSFLTGKIINKFKGKSKETIREKHDAGYISGCAMLIRSEVLKDVGLLDPIYFLYQEDADFGRRVKNRNFRIVCVPTSYIWHKHSATASKVKWLWFYYGVRNRFIFQKRYATKTQFLAFLAYVFIYQVPYTIATCLFYHRDLHYLKMFFKGLREGLLNE